MQDCASNVAGLPGSGWRLPAIKELQTIVDRSRANPAIDQTLFFGLNDDYFWSATCNASGSVCPAVGSSAWYVSFYQGVVDINDANNHLNRVRCVR